jgi:hypothetical protein
LPIVGAGLNLGADKSNATKIQPTMNPKPTPPPAVRKWYSEIGKLGGKSKSPAKLAAIKENAKKGGWPKGRPRKPRN